MADDSPSTENPVPETSPPEPSPARGPSAVAIALSAWLVPGAGHLILGRRVRALVIFAAVAGLVLFGVLERGNLFTYHPGDAFSTLGFLADAGSGVFYAFARWLERSGSDVSRAAGDYGTRFLAAAGILNLLAALDAHELASRRRT